ncbi:unnamed protein product [Prorocentrum cordatum]|uniref:CRAL-TRIO domain-containing protein n=1 Tax=Prorocentrum cordatum TaxID=2364126 RepID=A0ABN9TSN3_9DINO|nr:unnamed protein product [Polarella glacialis]
MGGGGQGSAVATKARRMPAAGGGGRRRRHGKPLAAPLLASVLLLVLPAVAWWRREVRAAIGLRLGRHLGPGHAGHATSPPLALLDRRALLKANHAAVRQLRANTSSPQSDHDLLAHLRAASLNHQSPSERVLETDAWRRSSGIAAKMSDAEWRRAERDARRVLKCDFLGLDADCRPVLVQHVGRWDIIAAVEQAAEDLDRFVMLNAMICEVLLRMPRPAGAKDARGVVVIMDMEGLGTRHLSARMLHAFKAVAHVVRRFYPDLLAHMFVVNAPWAFVLLKAAIQPLFSADSLSTLHISSGTPPESSPASGSAACQWSSGACAPASSPTTSRRRRRSGAAHSASRRVGGAREAGRRGPSSSTPAPAGAPRAAPRARRCPMAAARRSGRGLFQRVGARHILVASFGGPLVQERSKKGRPSERAGALWRGLRGIHRGIGPQHLPAPAREGRPAARERGGVEVDAEGNGQEQQQEQRQAVRARLAAVA